jgi:glutamine synthetase
MRTKVQTTERFDTYLKLMKSADYVLLQFTDLIGGLRGRTIPAEKAEEALREGVTFDGSSMIGGAHIEDSDMIMKPDASTFTAYPYYFYNKSVAALICSIQRSDGKQF